MNLSIWSWNQLPINGLFILDYNFPTSVNAQQKFHWPSFEISRLCLLMYAGCYWESTEYIYWSFFYWFCSTGHTVKWSDWNEVINFDKPQLTKECWNPAAPPTFTPSPRNDCLSGWDCVTPWRTQSPSQSGNTSSLREGINHICRSRSLVHSGKGSPIRANHWGLLQVCHFPSTSS